MTTALTKRNTLRTLTGILAAAALLLASAPAATASEAGLDMMVIMSGTGKLKAKGVGTLKIPVVINAHMLGTMTTGAWAAIDDEGNRFQGAYVNGDMKKRKWTIVFDAAAQNTLARMLERLVRDETGYSVQITNVTQSKYDFKLDKKWFKVTSKLVFNLSGTVNGQFRSGTYTVPLKGIVTSSR